MGVCVRACACVRMGCMCVCVYVHVYVYVYVYVHACVRTFMDMRVCRCMSMYF